MPAIPDCSELSIVISKLAMSVAEEHGVGTVDEVVKLLESELPGISRDDVVQALVEANRRGAVERSELAKRLASIKQEARTDTALNEQIDALVQHLEAGTLPEPKGKGKPPTDAIARLREIRDGLKKQISKSDAAVKKRLKEQIAYLTQKIKSGDIAAPTPRDTPELTGEVARLKYQRDRLRAEINRRVNALKPRSPFEYIGEPFNLARAIMTSADFSAVLRQGGFITIGNPVRALSEIPDMLRAFSSPRRSHEINSEIFNRPTAPLQAAAGLHLSPIDGTGPLGKMEEAYMTRFADKIPIVAASERAYLTFLNKLRADTFDSLIRSIAPNGAPTLDEAKAIANYVNVATGRGNLGAVEKAAVVLNTMFFAPKLVASRFQLLAGQPLYRGSRATRTLIAREYAKFLIGLGVIYGLAKTAGFEVEVDPRSSDFGKIRIGNTRIDPLAGLSQVMVLVGRVISGGKKSSTTGKVTDLRGPNRPYSGDDVYDVMTSFGRSKLSPIFGTAVNVAVGENVVGEPTTVGTVARSLGMPMVWNDVYEAMRAQGVPKGTALAILPVLGAGLQTYGPTSPAEFTSSQIVDYAAVLYAKGESGEAKAAIDEWERENKGERVSRGGIATMIAEQTNDNLADLRRRGRELRKLGSEMTPAERADLSRIERAEQRINDLRQQASKGQLSAEVAGSRILSIANRTIEQIGN